MGDFFHDWRRKAGCATLVMACVFMTGWIRSEVVFDSFYARLGTSNFVLQSKASSLSCCWDVSDWLGWGIHLPEWETHKTSHRWNDPSGSAHWKWRFRKFEILIMTNGEEIEGARFIGPYWSVVAPLTLLSAYLLLWKPRKRESRPTQIQDTTQIWNSCHQFVIFNLAGQYPPLGGKGCWPWGLCVLNRGVGRRQLFEKAVDDAEFLSPKGMDPKAQGALRTL